MKWGTIPIQRQGITRMGYCSHCLSLLVSVCPNVREAFFVGDTGAACIESLYQ